MNHWHFFYILEECKTAIVEKSYGTNIGEQCVFPFTYGGVTYDSCAKTADTDCLWCPTKLDDSGVYFVGGEWGCCNDVCPKTTDKSIYLKVF